MEDATADLTSTSTSPQSYEAVRMLESAFPRGQDRGILVELSKELLANIPAVGLAISHIKTRRSYNRLYKVQEYLKHFRNVKEMLSQMISPTGSVSESGDAETTPELVIAVVLKLSGFLLEETGEGKKAFAILWIISRFKPGIRIRMRFIEAILRSKVSGQDEELMKTLSACLTFYKSKKFGIVPKSSQLTSWFLVIEACTNYMLPKDCVPYQKILNSTDGKEFYLQQQLIVDAIENRILALEGCFEDELVKGLKTSLTLLEMLGLVTVQRNGAKKDMDVICKEFVNPGHISAKMTWVVDKKLPVTLLGALRRLSLQNRLTSEDIPHAASALECDFRSDDYNGHGLVAIDGMLELVNIMAEVGLREERISLLETAYKSLQPVMGDEEQVVDMLRRLMLGAIKGGKKPKRIQRLEEVDQKKKDAQIRKLCKEWDLSNMHRTTVVPFTRVAVVKMMAETAEATSTQIGESEDNKLAVMIVQAFVPIHGSLEIDLGPAKFALYKHNEHMTNGYFREKDFKKAVQHYREVVKTFGKQYGVEDPFTMLATMYFGILLEVAKEGREGVQVLEQVCQFLVENMGESWGGTVEASRSLASCYMLEERFEKAQKLYGGIIKLSRSLFGDDSENPTTALARYNISVCEYFLGQEELGMDHLLIAKTLIFMLFPPDSPMRDLVVRTQKQWDMDLGLMHSRAYNVEREIQLAKRWIGNGHLVEALKSYRLIWRKSRMLYDATDIKSLTPLGQIGLIYYRMEKFHAARERFKKLAKLTEASQGRGHTSTVTSLRNLAKSLHKTGDYKEACELILDVSIIECGTLGREHPQTLEDTELFVTFHEEFSDYSSVSKNLEKLFASRSENCKFAVTKKDAIYDVN